MRSTLAPGKVPQAIAELRDSALSEANKPEAGRHTVGKLTFDLPMAHTRAPEFNQDDNTIAKFPGLISPHVGNGRGAAK